MMEDLSAAVAALIETLPDRASALVSGQVAALYEMDIQLNEAMRERLRLVGQTMVPARARLRSPQDTPLADLFTEQEISELERAQRLYLDAERALAALLDWDERSGLNAIMGWPYLPVEPSMLEDSDGSIQFVFPRREAA